jgi:gas vesicle protein
LPKTFWQGLVTGGLVGAMAGMVMAPRHRPRVVRATGGVQRRAVKLWRRTRGELGALKERLTR